MSKTMHTLFAMNLEAVQSAGVQAIGQLGIDLISANAKGVPGMEAIGDSPFAQILAGNALSEVETKFGITDAGILGAVVTAAGFRNLMAKAPEAIHTYIGRVKGGVHDLSMDPDEAARNLSERAAEYKRDKKVDANPDTAFNSAAVTGFNAVDVKAKTIGQPTVTKPGNKPNAAHNSAEAAPGNTVPADVYLPKSKSELREKDGKVLCAMCGKGYKRNAFDKPWNNDKPDAKWKGVIVCNECRKALGKSASDMEKAEKAEKERADAEARCLEISTLLGAKYEAVKKARDTATATAELDDEDLLAVAEAKVAKLEKEIEGLIAEQDGLAKKHGFTIETVPADDASDSTDDASEPASDDGPTPDKARVVSASARVDNAK